MLRAGFAPVIIAHEEEVEKREKKTTKKKAKSDLRLFMLWLSEFTSF